MKKIFITVIIQILLLLCGSAQAQYSRNAIDSAENILNNKAHSNQELLQLYTYLESAYSAINPKKAIEYAQKGIVIAQKSGRLYSLSNLYLDIAVSFYNVSGYDSATYYFEKSLDMLQIVKERGKEDMRDVEITQARVYKSMGNMYNIQGKYEDALSYYIKSIQLFEKHESARDVAIVYGNMSVIYMNIENWDYAFTYMQKEEAICRSINDSLMLATSLCRQYTVYMSKYDYENAQKCAETAHRIMLTHPQATIDDKRNTTFILANFHIIMNEFDKALQYSREALKYAETMGMPRRVSSSLRQLASIYLYTKQYELAEQTALRALQTDSTNMKNNSYLYERLVRSYIMLGNKEKAISYLEFYMQSNAQYLTSDFQLKLSEMEVKYETEKKEMKISNMKEETRLYIWLAISIFLGLIFALFFLSYRNKLNKQKINKLEKEKQLIATQAVLDNETAERTRFARDLHDGLGGMLTAIKLNLNEMKKGVTLEVADVQLFDKALGMLDDSIRELRRVAYNMMPDSLSRYGLETALSDFCSSITAAEFKYYGEGNRLERKMEVMIYRIIHELVNNAMKHAEATHILVQIMQETNRIAFTVQDNGRGFDINAQTKGTGLVNIRTRVASYNGSIDINSKIGEGTEVNVELRIKN